MKTEALSTTKALQPVRTHALGWATGLPCDLVTGSGGPSWSDERESSQETMDCNVNKAINQHVYGLYHVVSTLSTMKIWVIYDCFANTTWFWTVLPILPTSSTKSGSTAGDTAVTSSHSDSDEGDLGYLRNTSQHSNTMKPYETFILVCLQIRNSSEYSDAQQLKH